MSGLGDVVHGEGEITRERKPEIILKGVCVYVCVCVCMPGVRGEHVFELASLKLEELVTHLSFFICENLESLHNDGGKLLERER